MEGSTFVLGLIHLSFFSLIENKKDPCRLCITVTVDKTAKLIYEIFCLNRVLCKFFAHGACLKGEHCEYSHDWKAPPNNVSLC